MKQQKASLRSLEATLNSGALKRNGEEWKQVTDAIRRTKEEMKRLEEETKAVSQEMEKPQKGIAAFGQKWFGAFTMGVTGIKALQSNYPDFVVTETDGGFKPATPPAKGKADTEVDAIVAGFKKG